MTEAHPATTGQQPIDLDRIEELAQTYPPDGWVRLYVPRLVAELRAARELRDDVGVSLAMVNGAPYLEAAAQRYDQAVGGAR